LIYKRIDLPHQYHNLHHQYHNLHTLHYTLEQKAEIQIHQFRWAITIMMTSKPAVFQALLLLIFTTLVRSDTLGSSTASTLPAAATSLGPIPTPTCYTADAGLDAPSVKSHIQEYCGNKAVWDLRIIPNISRGKGNSTGVSLAESYSVSYPISGSNDLLWLGVKFSNETCSGFSSFTIGTTDEEKYAYCARRFEAILNTCGKTGGSMKDVCINYSIIRSTSDVKPYEDTQPLGWFTCKKTDTSLLVGNPGALANTCQCWYSNYPGLTDTFKMPSDSNVGCNGTMTTDLLHPIG
jgi:hypothetical protein